MSRMFVAVAVLGVALFCRWKLWEPGSAVAAQERKYDLTNAEFEGVTSCIICHDDPKVGKRDLVLLTEYGTWKTADRHAQAFAVLLDRRGRQITENLGIKDVTDPTEGWMCLGCHTTAFRPGQKKNTEFTLGDGVGCEGCHGPAEYWVGPHARQDNRWRDKSPEDKEQMGLFDVRDPAKRAELCISCHVGSAPEGKVITHSMYAAGHPPLPGFELASFSQNLPPHWRDLEQVKFFEQADEKVRAAYHVQDAPFQHTKLVLAGSVAVARKAMELLAERADIDNAIKGKPVPINGWPPLWFARFTEHDQKTRWPELYISQKLKLNLSSAPEERWPEFYMGQGDCYACHHELKTPSWRQVRGYYGKPGRPQFPTWPLALARLTLTETDTVSFSEKLQKMRAAFDFKPFGDSHAIRQAAQDLASLFKKRSDQQPMTAGVARRCLATLVALSEKDYPDFDSARQIAWAFHAIYFDGWNAKNPRRSEVEKVFVDLDRELDLTLHSEVRREAEKDRNKLMAQYIRQTMTDLLKSPGKDTFLSELQGINDAELKQGLERISTYSPVTFKKHLAKLAYLLQVEHQQP